MACDAGGWKPDDVLDLHVQSQACGCSTYCKWVVQPQERFTKEPECVGAFPVGHSTVKPEYPYFPFGGSHNSMRLPSGSMIQAKRP